MTNRLNAALIASLLAGGGLLASTLPTLAQGKIYQTPGGTGYGSAEQPYTPPAARPGQGAPPAVRGQGRPEGAPVQQGRGQSGYDGRSADRGWDGDRRRRGYDDYDGPRRRDRYDDYDGPRRGDYGRRDGYGRW